MCLAIPGRIVSLDAEKQEAVIDYDGLRKTASTLLRPEVQPGQLALVHAGFIIEILNEDLGAEMQTLAREAGLYG